MNLGRSLNLEHVSLSPQIGPEISRRPATTGAEESIPTLKRRKRLTRKPDAGHITVDIPATLLQPKVFNDGLDFWRNAHCISLNHYRVLDRQLFSIVARLIPS